MKRILLFSTMLALSFQAGPAQNIAVTFTGTVPSVRIDSVTATNLATDESINFPGGDRASSGLNSVAESYFAVKKLKKLSRLISANSESG